jgi:hypothetical protein
MAATGRRNGRFGWKADIAPAQSTSDDENELADHPSVFYPRHIVREVKCGSIRRVCASDNLIR